MSCSEGHPISIMDDNDDDIDMQEVLEEDCNGGDEIGEEEEEDYYNEVGEQAVQFIDTMDPLSFSGNISFEFQPYQQLSRLESEVMADRKRKAIHDTGSDLQPSRGEEDAFGASIEEIMEVLNHGWRRKKSRKIKKKGRRRKGLNSEVTRKLGDATLYYASGHYDEAICMLKEVIRVSPNLADAYHTLGLVYKAMGDKRKALNFYMIAAHLMPKDPSLWKQLIKWSIEQENTGQLMYCLSKAITADPRDTSLRFDRASLYVQLGEYRRAAESYEQILGLFPTNVEACKMAAKLHKKNGQVGHAINILERFISDHPTITNLSIVNLLTTFHMEKNEYAKALEQIENARLASENGLPMYLTVKAGVCHVRLGNIEHAEIIFSGLEKGSIEICGSLIFEVADTYMELGHYEYALKYYHMLEGTARYDNGFLNVKLAECYLYYKEKAKAISFFYKALSKMEDNVDVRLTLASLLLEEDRKDETISLLSPAKISESKYNMNSDTPRPWWLSGKIKMQLAQVYLSKGLLEDFVDAILPTIQETLFIETMNLKVRTPKRLPRRVLFERIKVLDDHHAGGVFSGFRPFAATSDLTKASRAKKVLQKKAVMKEQKKAAVLAAGLDWQSDESDEEEPQALKEPPLPKLLKDEDHYQLILDLCQSLASLRRYWEALEIINHMLRLGLNILSVEKKEKLRSLGTQMAYNTTDPTNGYDCARSIVQKHPYSLSAWNCYYKVVSRLESRLSRHSKFLLSMRATYKDSVAPMIITGHQLTLISQHQAAAAEYLRAYKLQQNNPLINLCVGTSLINLALGFRLQNKNQCVVQGLAFLFNCLRLLPNFQEPLYNIARACHHVGFVTLAATYYEKVLAIHQKDYPIPKLPNEDANYTSNINPGYCSLHREAAYNLHLIYKKSGATDLARQILRDHCRP